MLLVAKMISFLTFLGLEECPHHPRVLLLHLVVLDSEVLLLCLWRNR